MSRNQILQILGYNGARRIFANHARGVSVDDDDDDVMEGSGRAGGRHGRRSKNVPDQFPKVPSEVGKQLMDSGTFGSNEYYLEALKRRKVKLVSRLMKRELGLETESRPRRENMLMAQVNMLVLKTADLRRADLPPGHDSLVQSRCNYSL